MTEALSKAWEMAGSDLGVEIVTPFELVAEGSRETVLCIAFVTSFGSPAGTVVIGRHAPSARVRVLAEARGMFVSMVDEGSFAEYRRDLFVDTLNDWGWYGSGTEAPDWFTGQPWTIDDHA